MEGELTLQINLNLQRLSMISFATKLWQRSDIKQEIKNVCTQEQNNYGRYPNNREDLLGRYTRSLNLIVYRNCYAVAQKVIQKKNSLSFPSVISQNLEQVIIYVGENLFDWIEYVTKVLGLRYMYAEKVYWTCTGMIDEEKIYWSYWKRFNTLNLVDERYFTARDNSIYVLACIHADVRFLQDSIIEMTNEMSRILPDVNVDNYNDKIYTFMSLWLYLNFSDQPDRFDPVSFSNSGYIIPVHVMIILCVHLNLNTATEYFFSKLNINDQQQSALDCAKAIAFQICRRYRSLTRRKELTQYELKKCSEMVTFFIKNLENEQRSTYLNEYHPNVIEALLGFWLFPELAISVINLNWPQIEMEDRSIHLAYANLLDSTLLRIRQDNDTDCPVKKTIFNTVLLIVWEKLPRNLKIRVLNASRGDGFINNIFNVFELDFLKCIFNDPDIAREVDFLLSKAAMKCYSLLRNEKYFLITEFITDCLPSDKWDNFLRNINLLEKLIKRDRFDIAEEILSILSLQRKTKTMSQFKSEIKGASICHRLVEKCEFDLADEYINWQFDTEEERKTFRATIKSNIEVIRTIIQNFWKDKSLNRDKIKKKCFDCLMYYCENNEEEVNSIRKENKFDLLEDDNLRNLILGL